MVELLLKLGATASDLPAPAGKHLVRKTLSAAVRTVFPRQPSKIASFYQAASLMIVNQGLLHDSACTPCTLHTAVDMCARERHGGLSTGTHQIL